MGISGNLRTTALADLLQWVAEGRKTGTLRIDNGTFEKKLFFFEGRVISTSSSDPKEFLGHFLVSHGFLNENELAKAVEMQESNKMLLGKILTTIGVLTEETLDRMLRLKSEESIFDLFAWSEAEFSFLDEELPEGTLVPMDLDVPLLVFLGMQRVDEWGRIRTRIPSAQYVAVIVRTLEASDPSDQAVLDAVNDDRTIAEIAMETHSGEYHVCRILLEQIESERLKVIRSRGTGEGEAGPITEAASAEGLVHRAEALLENCDYSQALRHLRAARSLQPDSGRVRDASEVAEARLRRELHEAGVELVAVPRLSKNIGDLADLDISPDQGFILSRINGTMDIQTILKITPLPTLDGHLQFLQLRDAGYIRLE